MLDRESQNDDTTIQWSTDGNSFIIIDQAKFEEVGIIPDDVLMETIPAYFGNPIVFASFLRKLQRWGFNRVSSRRSGRYEFGSPTFKRMDARSTSAPAAAAATTDTAGNASIQVPQRQQQTQAWPSLQQVMAQVNQQPMPAPNQQLPSQADANTIADLISNIHRGTQQPSTTTSSQQPVPNQMNVANAISMLQNTIGSSQQQQLMGQNAMPSQQPEPNHASQLNNVAGNNYLQSFQQWQHPNPTMNMLNTILHHLDGGPTSSAQMMGHSPPSSQINAVHALMSLSGMLQQQSIPNTTPTMSQSNHMEPVLSLLQVLHRFVEEEHQRRAQMDALHHVIIATIGHIVGRNNTDEAEGHRGAIGRSGEATSQNIHLRNPTGMTVRVPYNNTAQSQHEGPPPPSAGNNIQADSIAAILQAALRGDTATQPQDTTRAQNNGPVTNNGNNDGNDEGEIDGSLSPRKRKSSDNYDVDDDSWNKRLRKRKKSPP
eukprot:scaffold12953_cov123-Skeletonema_dohrnii-CCMP3373.AAC.6